jgi:hypothetical protein
MTTSDRSTLLLALRRDLLRLTRSSERACRARAALPPGSSRARVTTANARWACAAEARDRCQERIEALEAEGGTE